MSLHFDITADNKNFLAKMQQAEQAIKDTRARAEDAGVSLDKMWQMAGSAIGIGLSIEGIRQLGQAIINTRAEIEGMEISLRTLTGSAEISSAMMGTFKQIAASTPLELGTLARGAETLLSFGVEASKVVPTLEQIGDISGGDAQKFQALSLAFSQTSSTGKLMAQDLNQMINAGFNPLRQMSKDTGESLASLKEQMSAGAISVKMVEDAFKSATSEGGMFYKMLEAQGKGIKGAINGLSGAWADMLNEIGESQQGLIKGGYDLATSLVQNYKTIGEAIVLLASTYGLHKAALIAHTAIPSALKRLEEATAIKAEQTALAELVPLEVQEELHKRGIVAGTVAYTQAIKAETIAVRDSAMAKAQTLATEEALARKAYQESLRRQILARERMQQATQEVANAIRAQKAQEITATASQRATLQKQVDIAITNAQTTKNELNTASVARNTASKHLATTASARRAAMNTVEASTTALDTAATQANTAAKSISAKITDILTVSVAKLNAALSANKFTLIIAGIAAISYGLYKYATMARGAEKAQEDFNDTLEKSQKQYEDTEQSASEYLSTLSDTSKTETQKLEAWRKLIEIAPRLQEKYTQQTIALANQRDVMRELNDEIERMSIAELENKARDAETLASAFALHRQAPAQKVIERYGKEVYKQVKDEQGWWTSDSQDQERLNESARLLRQEVEKRKNLQQEASKAAQNEAQSVGTIAERTKEATSAIENASRQLIALRQGGSTATTEEIAKAESTLKNAKENYKALTGYDYDKQQGSASKAQDKARQERNKRIEEARKVRHELEKLALEEEEAIVHATQNGVVRRLRLIELEHDKRMQAIRQEREELSASRGGKLSDGEMEALQMRERIETARYQSDKAALREDEELARLNMLKDYGDYLDKRKAIKELAERDMANAETEWHKKAIQARLERELSALDLEQASKRGILARLYEDMTDKTPQYIEKIAAEGEALLNYISQGVHDDNNPFGITEDAMKALRESPEKMKALKDNVKELQEQATATKNPIAQMAKGVRDLFNANGDYGKITKAIDTIRQGIDKASSGLKFISGNLTAIGEATGSGFIKGVAESIGEVTNAMDAMSQGAQVGAAFGFGPIGQAAGAALGLVSSLAGTIAKIHDKKHEKRIKELSSQVETLGRSYDKLAKSVERAYSSDASRLIEQQEILLRQKQVALRQMAVEEDSKKKGDKGKADSYRREADEIDRLIEDNRERARDAIFGKDIKSAIDEFANAYAEAWANGNDRAEASKDFVRKQIKAIVLELIKQNAKPQIEKLRASLLEAWSDGVITSAEQSTLDHMAESLQQHIDKQTEQHRRFLEGNKTAISASRGGFETMSQDTGKALEGRFTAMHEAQLRIVEVGKGTLSVLEETRSLMVSSLGYLERIATNTKHLAIIEDRLSSIERNTRALK